MSSETKVGLLAELPVADRGRIVTGMRWTFWLSALGMPFSYGISVLLARTGPEVIGTYGLLMVYIGAVASLFYVGGDAVIIKFVPGLRREERLSFLISYFFIVAAFLVGWMTVSTLWPSGLRYLFGDSGGQSFQLLMVYLSPLYVLFSMTVAAHKAGLDMRTAHLLGRLITLGSFMLYALLFAGFRQFLATHPAGLIWGIYLGLTALATGFGLSKLIALNEWQCEWRSVRLFLPPGFWRYTLTTEQVSAVSFLNGRIDMILLVNAGGVTLLGKYVAIVSLADLVRAANRLLQDTLFPSLTNLFSTGSVAAASQLFSMNLRLLFAVNMVATFSLVVLVDPILTMLGSQYADLRLLFVLVLLFYGIATPGTSGAILLSSVGQQHRTFWIYLAQVGTYVLLFPLLWPRFQLLGAVLAMGGAMLVFSVVLLIVARRSTGVRFAVAREYAAALTIGALVGLLAIYMPSTAIMSRMLLWTGSVGAFLLIAGYSVDECRELIICFIPGRFANSL